MRLWYILPTAHPQKSHTKRSRDTDCRVNGMSAWLQKLFLLQSIPRAPSRIGTQALRDALSTHGFDISQRTVQRNLKTLAKAIPELKNDGNNDATGWFWAKDAPMMNLPALDPALALAFKLAENFLKPQLPEAVLTPLQPYFKAADAVLNATEQDNYHRWPEKVRFLPKGQPLKAPNISPAILTTIQDALFHGCQFTGTYQALEREPAEHVFNPLGLVYRGDVIYLVATAWDYQEPRHFALHRFITSELLDSAAIAPEGFSLNEHIKAGHFDWSLGSDIKLVAYFYRDAARILAETPLSDDQMLTQCEDDEEWFELSATVQHTAQLRWWLLEWEDNVEVLEPASLRNQLSDLIEALYSCYKDL